MIHQYRLNGYNIVLDINSGGVHVTDDVTYDLIALLTPPLRPVCPPEIIKQLEQKYDKQDIIDAYEDIYTLYENDTGSLPTFPLLH